MKFECCVKVKVQIMRTKYKREALHRVYRNEIQSFQTALNERT
jgi:hypothetical protein